MDHVYLEYHITGVLSTIKIGKRVLQRLTRYAVLYTCQYAVVQIHTYLVVLYTCSNDLVCPPTHVPKRLPSFLTLVSVVMLFDNRYETGTWMAQASGWSSML